MLGCDEENQRASMKNMVIMQKHKLTLLSPHTSKVTGACRYFHSR